MTVLPWYVPVDHEELAQVAMVAAQNDCLYRTMGRYRFVVIVDTDEFLVPYTFPNLSDLVAHLDERRDLKSFQGVKDVILMEHNQPVPTRKADLVPKAAGSFVFQNVFFPIKMPALRLPKALEEQTKDYDMMVIKHLLRTAALPPTVR
jgi:hypothetical protein